MDALEKAYRHSNHHRLLLERDSTCGCFYCLNIFLLVRLKSGWTKMIQHFVRIVE